MMHWEPLPQNFNLVRNQTSVLVQWRWLAKWPFCNYTEIIERIFFGHSPQYLKCHREAICIRIQPQFVLAQSHNLLNICTLFFQGSLFWLPWWLVPGSLNPLQAIVMAQPQQQRGGVQLHILKPFYFYVSLFSCYLVVLRSLHTQIPCSPLQPFHSPCHYPQFALGSFSKISTFLFVESLSALFASPPDRKLLIRFNHQSIMQINSGIHTANKNAQTDLNSAICAVNCLPINAYLWKLKRFAVTRGWRYSKASRG